MTLDEAINHAEECGLNMINRCETKECGKEHLQLAEWLKELKRRRLEDEYKKEAGDAGKRQSQEPEGN